MICQRSVPFLKSLVWPGLEPKTFPSSYPYSGVLKDIRIIILYAVPISLWAKKTCIFTRHPNTNDRWVCYYWAKSAGLSIIMHYFSGTPIPTVEYTDEEKKTWGMVYNRLTKLYKELLQLLFIQIGARSQLLFNAI